MSYTLASIHGIDLMVIPPSLDPPSSSFPSFQPHPRHFHPSPRDQRLPGRPYRNPLTSRRIQGRPHRPLPSRRGSTSRPDPRLALSSRQRRLASSRRRLECQRREARVLGLPLDSVLLYHRRRRHSHAQRDDREDRGVV